MYIRFLGGSKTVLPDQWTEEIIFSVMSGAAIDATAQPGDGAKLTVVTALSGTTVLVPPGARIRVTGGDILGSHSVKVEPGAGPEIEIQAIPILGSVKVRSPKPPDPFR
jgi:hypothetical protein